jgi:hypothetical protein
MKVTRADWSASVPWDGVTNKPDLSKTDTTALQKQITALQAQVDALLRNRSTPVVPVATGPFKAAGILTATWNAGTLHCLESVWADFDFGTQEVGSAVIVVPPVVVNGITFTASVVSKYVIRLMALNTALATTTVASGDYLLFTFY